MTQDDQLYKQLSQLYGIDDFNPPLLCNCIEMDENDSFIWENISNHFHQSSEADVIFLFLSLAVSTMREKRASLSQILEDHFGLHSKVVDEKITKTFGGYIRTGIVMTDYCQLAIVLKTLYALQYHSFVAIAPPESFISAAKLVLDRFQSGTLTKTVLQDCCKQVIVGNGMFLHVLVGCDGLTVNQFSRDVEV